VGALEQTTVRFTENFFELSFEQNFRDPNSYFDLTTQGIQHSMIFAVPPKLTCARRQE
jgi:hypothetical protein